MGQRKDAEEVPVTVWPAPPVRLEEQYHTDIWMSNPNWVDCCSDPISTQVLERLSVTVTVE